MSDVKLSAFNSKLKRVKNIKDDVMPKAFTFFRSITPIKSGNARRHTFLNNKNEIDAGYQYASRLDEGSSNQAPKGMVQPTLAEIKKLVKAYIKKIGA